MSIARPSRHAGLRHVALFVKNFEETEKFYVDLMGMQVEWRPDNDNVYLCSGNDNLALHRAHGDLAGTGQKLDHIGFIVDAPDQVDAWYEFLKSQNTQILNAPKTHRDGARSFYFRDPDGTQIQLIYHPPISGQKI